MSVGAVNKQTGDRIPTAGMPAIDDALDLTSVNPVQNAVITAALANKQDKTDNNLETTAKTIVGAINEHEGDIGSLMSGLNNVYNNAFMYISADPVSDGQTYYIDISDYTFRNTRTGIFVIIGNLTTGTTIVNGIWDANTFIFKNGSGVTYDATNQKIVVDEGANAWFIPYLVLPSFVISA